MNSLKTMKYLVWALLGLMSFVQSYAQQSFTLDEAIAYGMEHSNSMKLNDLEMESAETDIKNVRSIGLPKVSGQLGYNYYFDVPLQPVEDFISPSVYAILEAEGLPTTTQGPPQTFEFGFVLPHQLSAGINANMLLFDGGYVYGLRAAKLYRDLIRKQRESSEEQIKSAVTKAYLAILIAEENKKTVQVNISTLEKSYTEVSAMYDAGFMESLDVDRIRLTLDNLETQVKNIDGLIELSKNLLKFQMGYPLDQDVEIADNLDKLILDFDIESTEEVTVDPSKRSDYQLLNTTQELNQLDLKRNKAAYYPNLATFASYQQNLQRSNLFSGDETGFLPTGVIGLQLNVPIYDGGATSANIQKVKVNIEKVNVQKEEFSRGMQLQVQNAQLSMANAKRNLENRRSALEMTESIYNRTKIKFTEGVGSSVEVTQAENSLFNAQAEVISALYSVLEAKIDLDIALGNL